MFHLFSSTSPTSPTSTVLDLYIIRKCVVFFSQIIIKIKTIKMKTIRMKKILMLSNPKIYILSSVTSSACTFLFPLIAEKNVREREREREDGKYIYREREREDGRY